MTVADFAEAQAVAICWIANFRGRIKPPEWDGLHSSECGWCEYPQDTKLAAVAEFNLRPDADRQRERFFALGSLTKRRAIRTAQGYEQVPA